MTIEIKKTTSAITSYGDKGAVSSTCAGYSVLVDGEIVGTITGEKSFMGGSEWRLKVVGGYTSYKKTLKEMKSFILNNPEKALKKVK